jgi:hypothetical protein
VLLSALVIACFASVVRYFRGSLCITRMPNSMVQRLYCAVEHKRAAGIRSLYFRYTVFLSRLRHGHCHGIRNQEGYWKKVLSARFGKLWLVLFYFYSLFSLFLFYLFFLTFFSLFIFSS